MSTHRTTHAGTTSSPRHPRGRKGRALGGLAVALAASLLLGACSSGSGTSSSAAVAGPAVAPGADSGVPGIVGAGGAAAPDKAAVRPAAPIVNQKLVRTATLRMRVDQVGAAAADVRAIAVGLGGVVSSENISSGDGGDVPVPDATGAAGGAASDATTAATRTESGTMTVQVPSAKLDAALDQLGKLGSVLQRTTSTDDVTATYVDTASRVATMQASIARLRALMAQTSEIGQIVSLETELSKREADLESMQATLAALDQQTTMSTVSISLATKAAAAAETPGGSGFLYGLRGGWGVFVGLLGGLVTGLGALLPFLVTLVLVGVPARIWWQRRNVKAAPSARSVVGPPEGRTGEAQAATGERTDAGSEPESEMAAEPAAGLASGTLVARATTVPDATGAPTAPTPDGPAPRPE